jgi:hypothetical protein
MTTPIQSSDSERKSQFVCVLLIVAIHIHLRAETKLAEHRSALTPTTTAALLKAGFKVSIERSDQRIFDDAEFGAYIPVVIVLIEVLVPTL